MYNIEIEKDEKRKKWLLPDIYIPYQSIAIQIPYKLISVNKYLIPRIEPVYIKGKIKHLPKMTESIESVDFKKQVRLIYEREVQKQNWDIELTKYGFIDLNVDFTLTRIGEDPNNMWKILCDSLKGIVVDDDKNIKTHVENVTYAKEPSAILYIKHSLQVGLFYNYTDYNIFKQYYNYSNIKFTKKDIENILDGKKDKVTVDKINDIINSDEYFEFIQNTIISL